MTVAALFALLNTAVFLGICTFAIYGIALGLIVLMDMLLGEFE